MAITLIAMAEAVWKKFANATLPIRSSNFFLYPLAGASNFPDSRINSSPRGFEQKGLYLYRGRDKKGRGGEIAER